MFGPICISQNWVLGKTFPFWVFNFFQFWLKFKSICFRSVALLCCSLYLKMNLHCPCNWTRYLCKFAFTLLHCRTGYTMFEFAAECYCNLQNAFRSSNVEEKIIFYSGGGPPKGKNSGLHFLTPAAHTFCSKSKSIVQKNAFCQLSMSTLSLEQAGGNVYFDLFKCGRISQWSGDEIYWMANSLLSRCRPTAVPSRNPQGFSPATFQSWVESTIPIVYICFNFDTVFSRL